MLIDISSFFLKKMGTNERTLRADWDQTGDRFVNSDSIPPAEIKLEHIGGNMDSKWSQRIPI